MKDTFERTSTCIPGGYPRSAADLQLQFQKSCSPLTASRCSPGVQNPTQYMEDRSDSGINSGSEGPCSPPGSENSAERFPSPNDQNNSPSKLGYHSTPIFQKTSRPYPNVDNSELYPWRSLTSLASDVKMEPENFDDKQFDSNRNITSLPREEPHTNPLKCLEMSFERNLDMSSASPVNSEGDDKKWPSTLEEYDERERHSPRVNSHGKIKTFPCKQCSFVANTKLEFWKHRKTNHIKPEKLLACHLCPFNTEYKHHFEYHLRNHEGSKPFKCEHCDYTCVNKSMLNSHKKSHSNIYQYRCADCHYVSKYCHSLKMHLRKHGHKPGMVLNPDGSPNPLPIIDVYGTRRGPKVKPIHEEREGEERSSPNGHISELLPPPAVFPLPLQQLMTQTPTMPVPLAYTFFQQALLYQNLERLARENMSTTQAESDSVDKTETMEHSELSEALDLSKANDAKKTPSMTSDDEDYTTLDTFKYVETVLTEKSDEELEPKTTETENQTCFQNFNCQYCKISFGDEILYTMHMGYHGYQDPFTCNMCGEKCNDKIAFFLHIARTPHSYNK
ncbi:hypothetical protein WA026_006827 [Henosepilachna vigintioctopunctata]|uniref:Protein hunchback n=1 Tax=Henosepilachna vigintioctopunctata TaxID=420089 RepID=A0AAW1UK47_9CUCU